MTQTVVAIKSNKLFLVSEFQHNSVPKSIDGASWSQKKRAWLIPLSLENIKQLELGFSGYGVHLERSPGVHLYIVSETEKRKRLDDILENGLEKSPEYHAKFYPHQMQGVEFMVAAQRCVLADEMGLGKTVQSLWAAKVLAAGSADAIKVLVVAKNNLKPNWVREINYWLPSAKVWLLDGPSARKRKTLETIGKDESGFIIVNYEGLRDIVELQKRKDITVLIVDEAHYLGNRKSQRTKAVKKVKAPYVFLLTGTPIMNRAEEFWSLLNILDPKLHSSYWRFMREYCELRHNGFGLEVVKTYADKLADDLKYHMIRRLKKNVLKDLPDKTYQTVHVELSPKQKEMYRQAIEELSIKLSNDEELDISNVLTQLIRFRQITVSARTIDEALVEKKNEKFEFVRYMLESTSETDGLVVFSAFRKPLRYLAQYLIDAKVLRDRDIALYDGESELIDDFQAGRRRLFLGTIKKAQGFDLYRASRVIRLDREWTPAENDQAEDRLHRIGQEENVTVYDLVVKGSVDEVIEQAVKEKTKLFHEIFDKRKMLEGVIQNGKDII